MGNSCSSCLDCCGMRSHDGQCEPFLQENERFAISELLRYLENRDPNAFFEGEALDALSTLAFSTNVDLQRSAALAFAEITEKDVRPVGRETLQPILSLLQSHDVEVQRAASAALGNLAVDPNNKLLIVELGGLDQLINQMRSTNVEVQCNAVGCITNLATHGKDCQFRRTRTLGRPCAVKGPKSPALQLVNANAIPVLVELLTSPDPDVQYYCTTALSNIAVDESSHLIEYLIASMDTKSLKVQCQAALALRNLASDEIYQLEIVRCHGLPHLLRLLTSAFLPLILSSVACVRNISIHPANESPIIDGGFVLPLIELLSYEDNEEIQCHAISTLRNLAASSERNKRAIVDAGAVNSIKRLIGKAPESVQTEMTAAIAVLALSEELKQRLVHMDILKVLIPLTSSSNMEVQGNSAAAIGNLSAKVQDYTPFVNAWESPSGGLHQFLRVFLDETQEITFQHIGVWTIEQFMAGGDKRLMSCIVRSKDIVDAVLRISTASEAFQLQAAMMNEQGDGADDFDGDIVKLAKKVALLFEDVDEYRFEK
ncbi:vacuolar protein 8 [Phycomyces nitens]|nr:vacuolar protein 8 [Phycomyces nitens]